MDDVIEFFVLLHISYFCKSTVVPKHAHIARVCMVTTVNICKVIFDYKVESLS